MAYLGLIFNLVPRKIWVVLGATLLILGFLYLVYNRGYQEGKSDCEYSQYEQQQILLQEKINLLDKQVKDYITLQGKQQEAKEDLKKSLSKVTQDKEKLIKALENAKNTEPAECSNLSPQRYELYKQLYNTKPINGSD